MLLSTLNINNSVFELIHSIMFNIEDTPITMTGSTFKDFNHESIVVRALQLT